MAYISESVIKIWERNLQWKTSLHFIRKKEIGAIISIRTTALSFENKSSLYSKIHELSISQIQTFFYYPVCINLGFHSTTQSKGNGQWKLTKCPLIFFFQRAKNGQKIRLLDLLKMRMKLPWRYWLYNSKRELSTVANLKSDKRYVWIRRFEGTSSYCKHIFL